MTTFFLENVATRVQAKGHRGVIAVGWPPQRASYRSQFELQAIKERGWLLTKAAELATSRPKTTVNASNFAIAQIESP